jgi:hypothetical protein
VQKKVFLKTKGYKFNLIKIGKFYKRVQKGELDGAHMLAAMLASMRQQVVQIISPFTMSYNGAGITVSNAIWTEMKKYSIRE